MPISARRAETQPTIEGYEIYKGPYEFELEFAIVLDAKNGLIFSFVWHLQD